MSAATSAKTDKELLRTIAQGKPRTAMPAWQDRLAAEDQEAALQYIRSLVRFSRSPAPRPHPLKADSLRPRPFRLKRAP